MNAAVGYFGIDTLSQLRSSSSKSDIVEPIDTRAIAMDYDVGLSVCGMEIAGQDQSTAAAAVAAVHPAATSFDVWKARLAPLRALEHFFATNDKNHYFSDLHKCVTRDGTICWTTQNSILLLESKSSSKNEPQSERSKSTTSPKKDKSNANAASIAAVASNNCSCIIC